MPNSQLTDIFQAFEDATTDLMWGIAEHCSSLIYPGWSRGLASVLRMSEPVDYSRITTDQLRKLRDHCIKIQNSVVTIMLVIERHLNERGNWRIVP